jgi:hypothetical protein
VPDDVAFPSTKESEFARPFKVILITSAIVAVASVLHCVPLIVRPASDTSHPSAEVIAGLHKRLRDLHGKMKRAEVRRRLFQDKVKELQIKMAMDDKGSSILRTAKHTAQLAKIQVEKSLNVVKKDIYMIRRGCRMVEEELDFIELLE